MRRTFPQKRRSCGGMSNDEGHSCPPASSVPQSRVPWRCGLCRPGPCADHGRRTWSSPQTPQPAEPSTDGDVPPRRPRKRQTCTSTSSSSASTRTSSRVPVLAGKAGSTSRTTAGTYTFTLREGRPLPTTADVMDSEDVVASLERYREHGATGNKLDLVESNRGDRPPRGDADPLGGLPHSSSSVRLPPARPRSSFRRRRAAKGPNEIEIIGIRPLPLRRVNVPDSPRDARALRGTTWADERHDGPRGFGGRKTAYFDTVTFRTMPESAHRWPPSRRARSTSSSAPRPY